MIRAHGERQNIGIPQPRSGLYSKPDALIASPALAHRFPEAVPEVIRAGLDRQASAIRGSGLQRSAGTGRPPPTMRRW